MGITKLEEKNFEGIPPKIVKISEELSCELTDVEWQNRARELAEAHRRTESEKERKKSVLAELGADVKIAEQQETKLANIVATRSERREVTVEIRYDYEQGFVKKTRTDTGTMISKRDMTTDERQGQLDFVDPNEVIESRHEEPKNEEEKA